MIAQAIEVANRHDAPGYLAQLNLQLAAIAQQRKDGRAALDALRRAATFANEAGAGRLVAEVALRRAAFQRATGDATGADRSLVDGIGSARTLTARPNRLPASRDFDRDVDIRRRDFENVKPTA